MPVVRRTRGPLDKRGTIGAMTPDNQRIAIARAAHPELAKWPIEWSYTQNDDYEKDYVWIERTNRHRINAHQLPDYLNDLNAMHEAEGVLSMSQRRQCILALRYVIAGSWPAKIDLEWQMKQAAHGGPEAGMYDHGFCAVMMAATAAQRAEAYLKTLNLWTE